MMNYLDYVNFIEKLALNLTKHEILNLNSKAFEVFKRLFDNEKYETFQLVTTGILKAYTPMKA